MHIYPDFPSMTLVYLIADVQDLASRLKRVPHDPTSIDQILSLSVESLDDPNPFQQLFHVRGCFSPATVSLLSATKTSRQFECRFQSGDHLHPTAELHQVVGIASRDIVVMEPPVPNLPCDQVKPLVRRVGRKAI